MPGWRARHPVSRSGGRAVRQIVCGLAVVALAASTAVVRAQGSPDEASLKLVHETVFKAVASGNLTLIQGLIHTRASGFFRDSQQPVQLGSGVTAADVLPTLLADLGHFQSIPTDTVYRVIGTVGVVNMTSFQQRNRNERGSDRYLRGTYIYAWDGGSWKLVSWHGSDTPLKK